MELAFDHIAFALCATARALGHALAHFRLNIYPFDLLVSFDEFRHQANMCVIVCMCASTALELPIFVEINAKIFQKSTKHIKHTPMFSGQNAYL